jgi:hypothetical protein
VAVMHEVCAERRLDRDQGGHVLSPSPALETPQEGPGVVCNAMKRGSEVALVRVGVAADASAISPRGLPLRLEDPLHDFPVGARFSHPHAGNLTPLRQNGF